MPERCLRIPENNAYANLQNTHLLWYQFQKEQVLVLSSLKLLKDLAHLDGSSSYNTSIYNHSTCWIPFSQSDNAGHLFFVTNFCLN